MMKINFFRNLVKNVNLSNLSHQKIFFGGVATHAVEKWDLLGAVCVERKPVIIAEPSAKEKQFLEYLNHVEFEKSMKSLHESEVEGAHVLIEKHLDTLVLVVTLKAGNESAFTELEITAEALKKGEVNDLDLDTSAKQTAQDFEDACIEELSKFKLASTITAADKTNDTKSINRKLSKHLVYVTHQQIGKNKYIMLPQVLREEGETMRQTAERALKLNCDGIEAKIFGNAPSGFYKYRYPKTANKDAVGAKVFIYFARYLNGDVNSKNVQFEWLDRNELENKLPEEYYKNVQKFLIDE